MFKVISDRKGSNPGGWTRLSCNERTVDIYMKYSYGCRLGKKTGLKAENQPFYEAIQNQVARQLGLTVPNTFVISGSSMVFDDTSDDLSGDRSFYFCSVKYPECEDIFQAGEFPDIERELFGLERGLTDTLLISDVENKGQNYLVHASPEKMGIVYLDIGCGIVCTIDGFIKPASGLSKNNYRIMDRKSRKRKINELERYSITDLKGNQRSLYDIVQLHRDAQISLGVSGEIYSVDSLISQGILSDDEMIEFCDVLMIGIENNIKTLKRGEYIQHV
jgi:hypothetical protein